MSTLLILLLTLVAVLLLSAAGIYIWYRFRWLKQPQIFLVSVPWKDVPLDFDVKETTVLSQMYDGRWATKEDLQKAMYNGMYVDQAGYLSDVTQLSTSCGDNPEALFTDVSLGVAKLASACSRGYYIVGSKPTKSDAAIAGTHFTVQPWNQTTGQWNLYELSSLSDLWKALTGR